MILIFKFIAVLVLLCNLLTASANDFPKCKVNDFDCQLKSAKDYSANFAQGIPSLDLLPLDPVSLDTIEGDTNGLKMKFTNVVVTGLKNSEVESWQMDLEKPSLKFSMTVKVVMKGDYKLSGRLLILPIEGDGKFKIDVRKLKTDVDAEIVKKTGDGKEYWQISKYSYKIDPMDIVFRFQNLFNGNEQLSEAAHSFANTQFRDVTTEVGGPVLEALHKRIIKHINKFLRKVPNEELFLP